MLERIGAFGTNKNSAQLLAQLLPNPMTWIVI